MLHLVKQLRVFLIILFVGFFSVSTFALDKSGKWKLDYSNKGLSQLVTKLKKIKTFSGTFIQDSVDQKGVITQESRGELKADRSGLFYWHTDAPLEQTVISDGVNVTVYDPDLEQVTIQKVDAQSQTTPAILFSGDVDKIGGLFTVDLREFDGNIEQYLLIPKAQESLFSQLRVRFDGPQLKEIRITDSLGQESSMSFVHTEINVEFPKGTFVAHFPEGTDIIRDIPTTLSSPQN